MTLFIMSLPLLQQSSLNRPMIDGLASFTHHWAHLLSQIVSVICCINRHLCKPCEMGP